MSYILKVTFILLIGASGGKSMKYVDIYRMQHPHMS